MNCNWCDATAEVQTSYIRIHNRLRVEFCLCLDCARLQWGGLSFPLRETYIIEKIE